MLIFTPPPLWALMVLCVASMLYYYHCTSIIMDLECLVLPILLHRYLVKYGPGGVTFLRYPTTKKYVVSVLCTSRYCRNLKFGMHMK